MTSFKEFKEARRPSKFKVGDRVERAGDRYNKGFVVKITKITLGPSPAYDRFEGVAEESGGTWAWTGTKGMTKV